MDIHQTYFPLLKMKSCLEVWLLKSSPQKLVVQNLHKSNCEIMKANFVYWPIVPHPFFFSLLLLLCNSFWFSVVFFALVVILPRTHTHVHPNSHKIATPHFTCFFVCVISIIFLKRVWHREHRRPYSRMSSTRLNILEYQYSGNHNSVVRVIYNKNIN